MDYTSSKINHFNATNLKIWDKETKTTTIKHLKGVKKPHYFKGWRFDSITLYEINIFCQTNELELDKPNSKNY